jgi:hypothetical protein
MTSAEPIIDVRAFGDQRSIASAPTNLPSKIAKIAVAAIEEC